MKQKRGVSLVEVLVVLAILAVLTSLLVAVLVATKERAKSVVDISNLRQLGVAAAIYATDNDDCFPVSVYDLLRANAAVQDVATSPSDETPLGLAYEFRAGIGLDLWMPPEDFPRVSYIGPGEGGWSWVHFLKKTQDATNVGWLVNIVRADGRFSSGLLHSSHGRIQRLTLETAVISRSVSADVQSMDGVTGRVVEFKDYFGDFEE